MSNEEGIKNIPLVDLATQSKQIRAEVIDRMTDVIDNARYILGKEVHQFEESFAKCAQSEHCIGLANGTEALHMALRSLDIGPGDEVITAGNSFAATAFAIAYTGAKAVFVDVDPFDFNIDPDLIESAITDRTKAIIPVHLYGQPARMPEIIRIANEHGLHVVEDAAQAHGAEIDHKRCGSFGDIGCFSFYPGKNLGAFGDGGAATTSNEDLSDRLKLYRNYGQSVKNRHDLLGYNCRLDTLQACVLLTKLKYIENWTESRRQVARWYGELLSDTDLILPGEREGVRHVYHLYVVRHPERDALIQHLADNGIFAGIHYPNVLSTAEPFSDSVTVPLELPVCTQLSREIVSLPMYPEMTREQVERVADAVKTFSRTSVIG